MNIKIKQLSDEVLFAETDIVKIGSEVVEFLKVKANETSRKRIRLCMHNNHKDLFHEMIIVHPKGAYVRPHKHINKCESLSVIEGEAHLIFFTQEGDVDEVVKLAEFRNNNQFCCRIPKDIYHTLIITSEQLVFHETTTGPFRRDGDIFPAWAPNENDMFSVEEYLNDLTNFIV